MQYLRLGLTDSTRPKDDIRSCCNAEDILTDNGYPKLSYVANSGTVHKVGTLIGQDPPKDGMRTSTELARVRWEGGLYGTNTFDI